MGGESIKGGEYSRKLNAGTPPEFGSASDCTDLKAKIRAELTQQINPDFFTALDHALDVAAQIARRALRSQTGEPKPASTSKDDQFKTFARAISACIEGSVLEVQSREGDLREANRRDALGFSDADENSSSARTKALLTPEAKKIYEISESLKERCGYDVRSILGPHNYGFFTHHTQTYSEHISPTQKENAWDASIVYKVPNIPSRSTDATTISFKGGSASVGVKISGIDLSSLQTGADKNNSFAETDAERAARKSKTLYVLESRLISELGKTDAQDPSKVLTPAEKMATLKIFVKDSTGKTENLSFDQLVESVTPSACKDSTVNRLLSVQNQGAQKPAVRDSTQAPVSDSLQVIQKK